MPVPDPAYCLSRLSTSATVLYHDTNMRPTVSNYAGRSSKTYLSCEVCKKVEGFYSTPISAASYLCNIRNTTQSTTTTIINNARMKPARLKSHQRNYSPPVLLGLFAPWPTKKENSLVISENNRYNGFNADANLFTSKFADNGQNSLPDCPYYKGRRRKLFHKGPSGHMCLVTRSH